MRPRLEDDALSPSQRSRLREGLLGAEGVAWRRAQETRVALVLDGAAKALRAGGLDGAARARLARLLKGVRALGSPDPVKVTPELLDAVETTLGQRPQSDLLLLSRWANAEHVYASERAKAWAAGRGPRTREPKKLCLAPLPRHALDTLVRVASSTAGTCEGLAGRDAVRRSVRDRFARVSRSHVLAELPAPKRLWAISDLHVDVGGNLRHCLAFASHPGWEPRVMCFSPLSRERLSCDLSRVSKGVHTLKRLPTHMSGTERSALVFVLDE